MKRCPWVPEDKPLYVEYHENPGIRCHEQSLRKAGFNFAGSTTLYAFM